MSLYVAQLLLRVVLYSFIHLLPETLTEVKVNVKQSRYRPRVAQRVLGS